MLVRSRAETVTSNGLMEQEALKAVIEGEVVQAFCQTGIEDGTRRQGYTFESNAVLVRSRADTVTAYDLMEKAKADAITQAALDSMRR